MSGNYRFSPTRPGRKLFCEPRPRRRLGEQNGPVLQKRLLDMGVMEGASGLRVVLAHPEAYGALSYAQNGPKGALRKASQNTGGTQMASVNVVLAMCSNENLNSFGDAPHAAAKVAVEKRIKRCPDSPVVRIAIRVKKAPSDQSGVSFSGTSNIRQRSPVCLRARWRRMRLAPIRRVTALGEKWNSLVYEIANSIRNKA
jgi:Fe2+ transport system protein FeoA